MFHDELCVARATSILSRSVGRCVRSNIALIIRALWAFQEGTHGITAMCCVLCGFPKRRKLSHLSESERCDEFSPFLKGAYAEILHPSGGLVAERGVEPLSATRPLGVHAPP